MLGLFLSLNRGPNPSLNKAHVSWWISPRLSAASPCNWLSQSPSTISWSDSQRHIQLAHFVRLAKLYGILADAAGSPAFTHNLLLTCYRFKPRRPFLRSLKRKVPAAFPIDTYGSAISYNRNFGANPFTLLWPVNSPVYASQHLFCISASACCARLGSRLLVKLCRDGHFSPLNCARLAARVSFRQGGKSSNLFLISIWISNICIKIHTNAHIKILFIVIQCKNISLK